MQRIKSLLAAVLLGAALPASAAVTITAVEVGGDVVFTGAGTLNLTALSLNDNTYQTQGKVHPISTEVVLGAAPAGLAPADIYGFFQISGSGPFGLGSEAVADSGAGDRFGIADSFAVDVGLVVPRGYVSGAPLAGTLTFTGTDFGTLGVAEGTYVWTWGSGGNADSLTLNIVPEPASAAVLMLGATALLGRRHERITNYRKNLSGVRQ